MHRQIWEGADPIESRRQKKGEQAAALVKGITFRECAEKYIEAHASSWKSHATPAVVGNAAAVCKPRYRDMPVSTIEKPHVLTVLEPIWLTKTKPPAVFASNRDRAGLG